MKRKYVPIMEEGGFSDNFYNTLNNYMQILASKSQQEQEYDGYVDYKEDDNQVDYTETFDNMTSRIEELEQKIQELNNMSQSLPPDNSSMDLIKIAMEGDYENESLMLGEYANDPNIGFQGKQIINDIAQSVGFVPKFNSIYRSKEKQEALIKQGLPAVKNSFHLTGDAVDMKPSDWNLIPKSSQKFLKSKYDVIFHNNHYHLEPKGKP